MYTKRKCDLKHEEVVLYFVLFHGLGIHCRRVIITGLTLCPPLDFQVNALAVDL